MSPTPLFLLSTILILLTINNNGLCSAITLPGTGSNVDPTMQASPRVDMSLFSSSSSLVKGMAQIHDSFGTYLQQKALAIGCEFPALGAILRIESGGQGFDVNGRMIIRFENHLFKNYIDINTFNDHFLIGSPAWTGHYFRKLITDPWMSFHGSQDKEWMVLQFAQGLTDTGAIKSASYGAPQILGSNFAMVGFATPQDMFNTFSTSMKGQLDALIKFIQNAGTCLSGLRTKDFVKFASCYNGSGKATEYGAQIQSAYNAYVQVLATIGVSSPGSCSYKGLSGQCTSSCTGSGAISYPLASCPAGQGCCVAKVSCQPPGGIPSGSCIDQTQPSACSGGTFYSGLCPGDADIRCCSANAGATSSPTFLPTSSSPVTSAPVQSSCAYHGLTGTCKTSCLASEMAYDSPSCASNPNAKCCANAQVCSPPAVAPGKCMDIAFCTGVTYAGYCPGDSTIKCCVGSSTTAPTTSSPTTKSPTRPPTTAAPVTSPCTYQGLAGTCRQSCINGEIGYSDVECTGAGSVCCAPAQACSSGGVAGVCRDITTCSGTTVAGLCPGTSQIKCCLGNTNSPTSFAPTTKVPSISPSFTTPSKAPTNQPVTHSPISMSCTYDSLNGTCKPSSLCTDPSKQAYDDDECSDLGNVCCTPADPCLSYDGRSGICKDTALCPIDYITVPNLCNGGNSIQCCLPPLPTSSPSSMPTKRPSTNNPTTNLPTTSTPTASKTPTTKAPTSDTSCVYEKMNGKCGASCSDGFIGYPSSQQCGSSTSSLGGKCCIETKSCTLSPALSGKCVHKALCPKNSTINFQSGCTGIGTPDIIGCCIGNSILPPDSVTSSQLTSTEDNNAQSNQVPTVDPVVVGGVIGGVVALVAITALITIKAFRIRSSRRDFDDEAGSLPTHNNNNNNMSNWNKLRASLPRFAQSNNQGGGRNRNPFVVADQVPLNTVNTTTLSPGNYNMYESSNPRFGGGGGM
jgi:hypothetical protein